MIDKSLLATKLYVPPLRPDLIRRPRLVEQLDECLKSGGKLALVSAPAGYGKTTLLSEWVQTGEIAARGLPVAWLSLDPADGDPVRFVSYVIAAMQTVADGVGKAAQDLLRRPQAPPLEVGLTGLINEICAVPGLDSSSPLVLVIDDLHAIDGPAVDDALALLLQRLPTHMRVAVATRADPPLALSRWRALGQLVEIRAKDLRFTPSEVAAFLRQSRGLKLSEAEVAVLEKSTEGWAVGLCLAALSLEGRDASTFVRTFGGSHRFVLDYLVDQVLSQQPADVQSFLLNTAILDCMSSSLCDAVLDPSVFDGHSRSSAEIMEHLELGNLFVIPLDDSRQWYRYHHLFRDLLRERAERRHPDRLQTWHRRASEWYETHGIIGGAVDHALASGDAERVARLAERNVLSMMDHGELGILMRWLNALPGTTVRRSPWLCVTYAWAMAYSGQFSAAESRLDDAEEAILAAGGGSGMPHVAGHVAAIRAYLAVLRGEDTEAETSARRALQLLPSEDLTTRAFATAQLGLALRATHNLAAAADATFEASDLSRAAGDSHVAVITLCDLAGLMSLQGKTSEALSTYKRALSVAREYATTTGRELPAEGYVLGRMSTIYHELDDLETALSYAEKGVDSCRRWGWTERFLDCSLYLTLILATLGEYDKARASIREAKQTARKISPWYVTLMEMQEVSAWLVQGDRAAAASWAARWEDELHLGADLTKRDLLVYLMVVLIYIDQAWGESGGEAGLVDASLRAKLLEAIDRLPGFAQEAEASGQVRRLVRILGRQAMALQAVGLTEQALEVMKRIVAIAEPAGFVRLLVRMGEPMAKLLRQTAAGGVAVEYVALLLEVFNRDLERRQSPGSGSSLTTPHLSTRELQVVRLLAAGLSNQEIAGELGRAVGTVKKHTSNIYRKLGVRTRARAVLRARELGLI